MDSFAPTSAGSSPFHPELTRIDSRDISGDMSEIRLFAVMQNETLRLPYYLDYYRRAGVKRFFIIDNNSTDGTKEFLLAQPDCHVFFTSASYAASKFGVVWLNSLMDAFGSGHWIVLADADELLVYPHCEKVSLPVFCQWLDSRGYQGIFTVLLDMYSRLPLNRVDYKTGMDFLQACDSFDGTYHFVRRFGIPFLKPAFPAIEPIGGPRLRLCFPEQNTASLWPRLHAKVMSRVMRLLHRMGLFKQLLVPSIAPQAFKIPLVKWVRGYGFITSHRLNPIKLAPVTGAMLHFKYFQDFSERVQDAVTRGNHYAGSAEYKRYGEMMTQNADLTLAYHGSCTYDGSESLQKRGIVKSSPDWDKQCA